MSKKNKKTLSLKVDLMGSRHLINSEYRRGYLEGQRNAIKTLANLVDVMMDRQERVAANSSVDLCRQEIKFADGGAA